MGKLGSPRIESMATTVTSTGVAGDYIRVGGIGSMSTSVGI